MKNLFFIVGRGRSGTSLLSKILNQHSDIHIPPESFFFLNILEKYYDRPLQKKDISNFVNKLFGDNFFHLYWNVEKDELIDNLKFTSLELYPINLIKIIFKLEASNLKKKIRVFGHKAPIYFFYIKKLFNLFPESKFIHIVRHPVTNINSFKNVPFDLNNASALAHRWNFYNSSIEKFKKKNKKNFLTVKFEKLILDQNSTLEEICFFLNIDKKKIKFNQNYNNNSKVFWHQNLNKKINKDFLHKKNNFLKNDEIFMIEKICKEKIKLYKYPSLNNQKKNVNLYYLNYMFSFVFAKIYTLLEKLIFRFPLKFQHFIINIYTKILQKYN